MRHARNTLLILFVHIVDLIIVIYAPNKNHLILNRVIFRNEFVKFGCRFKLLKRRKKKCFYGPMILEAIAKQIE